MRNIRLTIAYDGTDFHGWQRQPKAPTLQACLETALERIVGSAVTLLASGRTDAGVHAARQVANFKTSSPIPCPNLVQAVNDLLPSAVRVREADEVPDEFHSRYAARSKTYRYRILQAPVCSPFIARFVYHYPYPLDRGHMAEAARLIEGRHDFASFAASDGAKEADS
jgi:tRNA pseudouridine38-40 synthase